MTWKPKSSSPRASRSRLGVYLPLAIAMLTCATRKSEFRFSLDPDIDFHPALSLHPSLYPARLTSHSPSPSSSIFFLNFSPSLVPPLLIVFLISTNNTFLQALLNLLRSSTFGKYRFLDPSLHVFFLAISSESFSKKFDTCSEFAMSRVVVIFVLCLIVGFADLESSLYTRILNAFSRLFIGRGPRRNGKKVYDNESI